MITAYIIIDLPEAGGWARLADVVAAMQERKPHNSIIGISLVTVVVIS